MVGRGSTGKGAGAFYLGQEIGGLSVSLGILVILIDLSLLLPGIR